MEPHRFDRTGTGSPASDFRASARYKTCDGYCEERERPESVEARALRQDLQIQRDVELKLQWDPSIDAKNLAVIVSCGVVTLTGEIGHVADRYTAEAITKRLSGVRAIADEIRVSLAAAGVRSDSEIAAAAADALKCDVTTSSLAITPIVQDGCVRLQGHVPSAVRKQGAELALRHLVGARMIINELSVGTEP
jgi:osmotically-inducible protein OsmY